MKQRCMRGPGYPTVYMVQLRHRAADGEMGSLEAYFYNWWILAFLKGLVWCLKNHKYQYATIEREWFVKKPDGQSSYRKFVWLIDPVKDSSK